MAILQVRGIDDELYNSLRQMAKSQERSISQEVLFILKSYLASPENGYTNSTKEFLNLSWDDNRPPEEIITGIRNSRVNKQNFGDFNGLLD